MCDQTCVCGANIPAKRVEFLRERRRDVRCLTCAERVDAERSTIRRANESGASYAKRMLEMNSYGR